MKRKEQPSPSLFPEFFAPEAAPAASDWRPHHDLDPLLRRLTNPSSAAASTSTVRTATISGTKAGRNSGKALGTSSCTVLHRQLLPTTVVRHPCGMGIFPPFIAQHATGCCCRNCLEKWHGIPKGSPLTTAEQTFIVDMVIEWLHRHYPNRE